MERKKFWVLFVVIAIVALGFFLRIYNIENAPPGVYPDEAVNGQDALRALETGKFEWFYPDNQGREGLFINIQALSLAIFGINVFALKFPSIIFGTLTVLGVYLLSKELFRNEKLALIASFLCAVSFAAINFSRIGFRAIMLPLILVFAFYFLWKGLRTLKWADFAIGGFIFGLGLHTYIAFRISPAILVATLFSLILSRPEFLKNYWKKILVFILFVFIAASPMLYTFLISHPEYLESRSGNISIFSPQVNQGDLAGTFLKSFSLSLIKYNFVGDMNWRHNYPPYPLLDLATGVAFLFGLIYCFIKLFSFLKQRIIEKMRNTDMDAYVFLLSWFFIMLAPEFLTAEGNPHALRAIGSLPATFIFAGITFSFIIQKTEDKTYLIKKLTYSIIILTLIVIGFFNILKYHTFWANRIDTARAFEKNLISISNYVNSLPPEEEKIIIAESMQRIPIKVFSHKAPNTSYYYPGEINRIDPKTKNFEIILTDRKNETISQLQSKFKSLKLTEVRDEIGMTYYVLK